MKTMVHKSLLFGATIVILLSACTHPEDDARLAAGRFNKCNEQFIENLLNDKDKFVSNFDILDYNYRESAERELRDILHMNIKKHEKDINIAQKYHDELQKRYRKNSRKKFQFNNAFLMALDDVDFDTESAIENVLYCDEVIVCLQQLQPLRPKIKQMCHDMEHHELVEREDNRYFDEKWKLVIGDGCVLKLEIIDSIKNNDQWKYKVKMKIKDGGHSFNALADIVYTLNDDIKNWQLTDVISLDLSIVKTKMYRNSIPIPEEKVISDYYGRYRYTDVTFTSKCDSPLLIGGRRWIDEDSGWETFVLDIGALSKKTIRCGYNNTGQPIYKIDFVEKK